MDHSFRLTLVKGVRGWRIREELRLSKSVIIPNNNPKIKLAMLVNNDPIEKKIRRLPIIGWRVSDDLIEPICLVEPTWNWFVEVHFGSGRGFPVYIFPGLDVFDEITEAIEFCAKNA